METNKIIKLNSGNYLVKRYGKYDPHLCFISETEEVESTETVDRSDLNLADGQFTVLYGNYFVSKKGTKCFKILPKEIAPHMLVRDDWGGCFNSYRGKTLPDETNGALYYYRAHSNGGGAGYDYSVLPKDWKFSLNEEDI